MNYRAVAVSGRAASGAKAFNLRFIFVKESEDRIESRAAIVNSIRRSFLFDVIPPLVSDYTPSRNITSRPIICLSILAAFRKIDRSLLDPRLCVNLIYAKSLDIIKPMEHHFSFLPFLFSFSKICKEPAGLVPVIIRQPGCRISEQLCIDIHRQARRYRINSLYIRCKSRLCVSSVLKGTPIETR